MPASNSLLEQLMNSVIPVYPSVTGLHRPISAHSLIYFSYALGWAWALLISFTGWGKAIGKLFRLQLLPASVACALGIATVICIGGILNGLHAIYAPVLFGLVAIGVSFYLIFFKHKPERYRWKLFWDQAPSAACLLLIAALLILLLRVAGTVRLGITNGLDDGPGYLAFPHKMLQLHNFASDPFSERRVTTGLGAGYFLQSFVVPATSMANAGMADRTLGLILFGGILFDLGVLFELSIIQIAWLELLAYLAPQEAMNLTFVILPVSMLLGMLWMIWKSLEERGLHPERYAWLAGALGGAAISLKSTYLPCVGTFALIPYLFFLGRKRPGKAVSLPVLAGLGALAVMAAWMIAMKATSGTYLFPVLGRGVDYSSYRLFHSAQKFSTTRRFVKIFLQGFALLILAIIQFFAERRAARKTYSETYSDMRGWFSIAILVAAAIAITAVNYASGGDSIWRYNFPQFFSALIIFYIVAVSILRTRPTSKAARAVSIIAAVSLAGMIFYYDAAGKRPQPFRELKMAWGDYQPSLRAGLTGQDLESPQVRAEYRAVEDSLPGNATALENTAFAFLFNYSRRNILIADWAGAASPAPGWPFRSDSNALAKYLRSNSVRYIVYDYGYGRWTDVEGCEALEGGDLNSEWLLEQWWLSILSHNQFDHLRARYRSTYDDGNIVVIDLDSPVANPPAEQPTWTLATDKDEMCSAVMAAYLAHPQPALAK